MAENNVHRVVLVLPGGGLRGLIQSNFLAAAEVQLGPLHKVVDLAVGASVGMITAASLAVGLPMAKLADLELSKAGIYFPTSWVTKLSNLLHKTGIYDYTKIIDDVKSNGLDIRFGDLKTKVLGVAASENDRTSHYFKSYKANDADRKLLDVLSYAFAAPLYFGAKNCPEDQRTYVDGGVGLSNNPVLAAFFEVLALGWTTNTTIVTVGTGRYVGDPGVVPYAVTSKEGVLGQSKRAITFGSSEAEIVAPKQVAFLDSLFPGITVKTVNPIIPAGSKILGAPKYAQAYADAGRNAAANVVFKDLFGLI